jgi:hypothetical protein
VSHSMRQTWAILQIQAGRFLDYMAAHAMIAARRHETFRAAFRSLNPL